MYEPVYIYIHMMHIRTSMCAYVIEYEYIQTEILYVHA